MNWTKPALFFRSLRWNVNEWNDFTIAGLALEHAVNSNVHFQLPNTWWVHTGGTVGGLGTTYCDRCARGGPALRRSSYISPWLGLEGDTRWKVVPGLWMNYFNSNQGRTHSFNVNPAVDFRVAAGWTGSLGLSYNWNTDDRQWYGNFTDAINVTHYTFAHLVQKTGSLQARVNYTATPTLTIQAYAEPFISKGQYSNVRELDAPRAAQYADRFKPYTDPAVVANPGGFNFKQFRSNVVVRWEYRPGSALFLVWQQGRQDFENLYGNRSMSGDLDRLFKVHPDNTFLVKVSYWLDR
jgi:hypothetical protein